jgi:phosphoserine phosphatase
MTVDTEHYSANSASGAQNIKNRKWLVVDFDGTCTIKDTTPLLPHLAGLFQEEKSLVEERLEVFSELEQEYFALYNEAKSKIQEDHSLFEVLDRLDDISTRVTSKVSASGVLKGLLASLEFTKEMQQLLERHSLQVKMRPHCGSVLSKIQSARQWDIGVLSINWCPSLIAASIQPLLENCLDVPMPIIWSNLVQAESGEVSLIIPGALAKKERIKKLKQEGEVSVVVYVGDSSTDLAALIEADVGILIGGSESTINMAKDRGVKIRPLSEYGSSMCVTLDERDQSQNVIWATECWSEVENILYSQDENTWIL